MKMNFSSLSLNLETSLPSFGLKISSISSFIEFKFLKNKKLLNSNFIKFEILEVKLIEFSSSLCKH